MGCAIAPTVSSKAIILPSGAIARLENLAHPVSHPQSQNSTLRRFAQSPKVHNPKPPYPYVEITVSHTGIGISKEFLPFLFDRAGAKLTALLRAITGVWD